MPTLNQLLKSGRKSKTRVNKFAALENNPQKKGVCIKVYTTKPKKPNSAIRKITRIRLNNGHKIIAYIPGEGHNLQEHSVVLIKAGRVPDLPGVKFKVLRGKYDAISIINRVHRRSLYGTKKKKNPNK
jgi:small subunit ribosomal protein S12